MAIVNTAVVDVRRPDFDFALLRAHLANAVTTGVSLLVQHNEGLDAKMLFSRLADMEVVFNVSFNEGEDRIYHLKLKSPDGMHASMARFDAAGTPV